MLLTIDIGNTKIWAALLDKDKIVQKAKTFTDTDLATDKYYTFFAEFLRDSQVEAAVVSSVVAGLADKITKALNRLGIKVMPVSADLDLGFKVPKGSEKTIGGDILSTNAAAADMFGDAIIIDAGTATTFQVLTDKKFVGCVIATGLSMSAKALAADTSLLPLVEIKKPDSVIGLDTVSCMQSGILYGHAAMIDGIVVRIEEALGCPFKTIGTGGAAVILNSCLGRPFDVIDNDLIFKGLKIIYSKNKDTFFKADQRG